jgi:hypothetical protein
MKSTDKKQIQLHKMELDEKYLSRKLLEISQNMPFIYENLRKYKSKIKGKHKGKAFVHKKAFVKILKINKRTMGLIIKNDLIPYTDIFGLFLFTIADVDNFLKINIKKHRY